MSRAGPRAIGEAPPLLVHLAEIETTIPAEDVAVVVAHPDDETIGCGAQLARLRGCRVFVVTDGAPRDLADARRYGFADAQAYAQARRRELMQALAVADVPERALEMLGVPDQQTALALPGVARLLASRFAEEGIRVVLTHSYEGGHPDHDATAFCVQAAARLLASQCGPISIIEMPFYSLGPHGAVVQSFVDPAEAEVVVRVTGSSRERKRRMLDAHATQREVLSAFTPDVERFRPAPCWDFAALPNGGRLLYELQPWGMTGSRWLELAAAARRELGIEVRR